MSINDNIMSKNIREYRTLLQNQANDSRREADYQAYVVSVKSNSKIGTPLVRDAYTKTHSNRNLSEIKNDIVSVSGINNFVENKTTSPGFSTFKLEGVYKGPKSKGEAEDFKEMNTKANKCKITSKNR